MPMILSGVEIISGPIVNAYSWRVQTGGITYSREYTVLSFFHIAK
jgi:hypothetical protein